MNMLTQKQEIFTRNLFSGMNQYDAYREAGYAVATQTRNTINANASRLANNVNVLARLEELNQKVEDASIASVIERKQVLSEIVRGRFADFMTHLTAEKLQSAALQEIRIVEFTGGKDGRAKEKSTTIKLHSPIQAIAELNKMERIYEAVGTMVIDNRTLTINVMSDKAKELTERLSGGERTEP